MRRMPITIGVLVLATCVSAFATGSVQASDPLSGDRRTDRFTVDSASLQEKREVIVRLPSDYHEEMNSYPVLYVTDAAWQFPVIAEYIEYLVYWKRIPPMIVVGVPTPDRNRDFVPRVDAQFPDSGGADKFLPFLLEELQSTIDGRYRSAGIDILFGHSFGGVLSLYTLFKAPDAFEAYIAVGTSTWVADRVLFDEANAFFDAGKSSDAMIFMSVAEADGGPTVPVGQEFAELWKRRASETLEWSFHVEPEASHFTALVPSLRRALDLLYPAWGFTAELRLRIDADGPAAVDRWFEYQHATLGWRFFPQTMELGELAFELAAAGNFDGARALTARLRKEAPRSPGVYEISSYVEMYASAPEHALGFVRQAIAIGEEIDFFPSRLQTYRNLAAQLEAELSDTRGNR